ncbi:polysaccharide biosynthesis tyrosine autokinase, partial [candidate division KSB1 bacterium]|nr:polysaccharide biosynthesis tyrosine autokinase [candidate division KSB1 bacterium]
QQQRLGELKRDQQVAEQKYLNLDSKSRDAKINEVVKSEEIEILDPAIVPEFPTSLPKRIQASLGGTLGIALGVFLVLLLEFIDKSIKTVDDVKRYLKLPVMGTIPLLDFSDVFDFQDSEKLKRIDQQLVTHDYSPTPIGEAYRSLRTNLLFSKDHGKIQSLVATSTEPGDGKSFTAANLAITFAQLKTNTLLIDGDLRRGVLHNTFGLPKEPGFSNYLTRMVPLQNILYETHIPNLTLITCGSLVPNPSELLGSQQMRKFLDEARRKYELIIFDSPPLNAATDGVVIGTQVDSAVMVIRAGKTNREFAHQKLELFSNVPAKVLGVILNGTTSDMAHPGYSYYHY